MFNGSTDWATSWQRRCARWANKFNRFNTQCSFHCSFFPRCPLTRKKNLDWVLRKIYKEKERHTVLELRKSHNSDHFFSMRRRSSAYAWSNIGSRPPGSASTLATSILSWRSSLASTCRRYLAWRKRWAFMNKHSRLAARITPVLNSEFSGIGKAECVYVRIDRFISKWILI